MRKTKKAKGTMLKKLFITSPRADENSPMNQQTSRTILNSVRGAELITNYEQSLKIDFH